MPPGGVLGALGLALGDGGELVAAMGGRGGVGRPWLGLVVRPRGLEAEEARSPNAWLGRGEALGRRTPLSGTGGGVVDTFTWWFVALADFTQRFVDFTVAFMQ
jgi:hypothetical protein